MFRVSTNYFVAVQPAVDGGARGAGNTGGTGITRHTHAVLDLGQQGNILTRLAIRVSVKLLIAD